MAVILLRGFQEGILGKYWLFCTQIAFVLVSFILLYIRYDHSPRYAQAYWLTQFITMIIASGVIVETLRDALVLLERARRFAKAIEGVFPLALIGFAVCAALDLRGSATEHMLISLERGFPTVRALLLLGIGGVIAYLRIPLSRNVKAMLIGYSLYPIYWYEPDNSAAAALCRLTHRQPGDIVWPLSYDLSLVVWVAGLWSYCPPWNADGNMEMATKSNKAGIMALTSPRYFSLGQDS